MWGRSEQSDFANARLASPPASGVEEQELHENSVSRCTRRLADTLEAIMGVSNI